MVQKRNQDNVLNWQSISGITAKQFTCGYCGNLVGPTTGYYSSDPRTAMAVIFIYICSFCRRPTIFDSAYGQEQIPGPTFGNHVDFLPPEVESIYNEARASHSAGAFSGSVMLCRKILMNVAVSKGATVGENFQFYIDYLESKNYLPPDGRDWVDEIRKVGNDVNHEIKSKNKTESEEIINFAEMLLKIIFEFPNKIKLKKQI